MSDYRRYFVPGGTYFLTVVTYNRRPILTTNIGRLLLRRSIEEIRKTSLSRWWRRFYCPIIGM